MGLAKELVSHPFVTLKLITRRIAAIPEKGLPKLHRKTDDGFDARYGVETSGMSWVTPTVGTSYMHGTRYEACSEDAVRWAIENCGLRLEETRFTDVGCGKGRALVLAAQYPFKEVVGVEYSPDLAETARRNMSRIDPGGRWSVICTDAVAYDFPDGDLLAFFYNPFDWVIYEKVVNKLATVRGRVRLAHQGPGNDDLAASGLFTQLGEGPDGVSLYQFAK